MIVRPRAQVIHIDGLIPPSLHLAFSDMRAGELDPRITFTRASSGLGVGASLEYEVFAEDVARLVYDPATGESLGLLIEPQATNILLNSDAPATQSVTVSNATVYTLACYGSGSVEVTAGGSGTATNGSPRTFTTSATTVTVTVTGSPDYFQLEIGSVATSPIITAGSQATRAADVAVMTGTNFSDWYNASEGTFVVDLIAANPTSGESDGIFSIDDGALTNSFNMYCSVGNTVLDVYSGGVAQASLVEVYGSKVAVSFKLNDFALATSGSPNVVTDLSGTMPVAVSTLRLGQTYAGNLYPLNGTIKSLSYYPARLSNATLQALTGA